MKATRRAAPMTGALALLIATGCSSPDERLVEVSERGAERQREQNQLIARQSEAVARENERIAEAARELVARDAEARREMIRAQRELHGALQAERSSIERQRDQLEQERREIAVRRRRDPVVAEAIRSIGTLLACLVPLIVVAYALSRMGHGNAEGEELAELLVRELAELLVRELASENPVLFPPRSLPALENRATDPPEEEPSPAAGDDPSL